jgi:hypothetical protein
LSLETEDRPNLRTEELKNRIPLFDDEESAFHPIIRDAVPHYTRLADCDHVLKIHYLSRWERRIRMRCAETAFAVIQQSAGDFLMRRIVE